MSGIRSEADLIREYVNSGAYWEHDGNPKRPHALLTSGQHSNGFFNSKLVIADDGLLKITALYLVELYTMAGGKLSQVDRVVGPQTGATKLAEHLAGWIGSPRLHPCEWASPAKVGDGKDKRFVFDDQSRMVRPGEWVLPCEDVVTTGGTTRLVMRATGAHGGKILPFMLAMVNRSGLTEVDGRTIVAGITKHLPTFDPSNTQQRCPLCDFGSVAIRPKEGNNWALLNADY